MKNQLRYALYELDRIERTARTESPLYRIDVRAKLIVTVVFLVTMLSLPLSRLSEMMLFFIYPIIASSQGGLDYPVVFRRSLLVLPFVVFIGIFNLLYDREPVLYIGSLVVTDGAICFCSIVIRGILSVQALLVLISSTGFYTLCRGLQRLGMPSVFTVQLLFVYRYISVLIQEGLNMSMARDARSFGRSSYPLRVWGTMVGQLLIRTFGRAEQIYKAMLSRGFTGRIPGNVFADASVWSRRDASFLFVWCTLFVAMRIFYPVETFFALINSAS